jgi:hypothetical protein
MTGADTDRQRVADAAERGGTETMRRLTWIVSRLAVRRRTPQSPF